MRSVPVPAADPRLSRDADVRIEFVRGTGSFDGCGNLDGRGMPLGRLCRVSSMVGVQGSFKCLSPAGRSVTRLGGTAGSTYAGQEKHALSTSRAGPKKLKIGSQKRGDEAGASRILPVERSGDREISSPHCKKGCSSRTTPLCPQCAKAQCTIVSAECSSGANCRSARAWQRSSGIGWSQLSALMQGNHSTPAGTAVVNCPWA